MFNQSIGMLKASLGDFGLWVTNHIISHVPSHTIRRLYYSYIMGYEIGLNSSIFMGAEFDARRNYRMGQGSTVNQNCRLDTRGGIRIGDNVSISAEVCILTADHNLTVPDFLGRVKKVVIEDFVFVGTRALILPGVRLGYGSAVAAGAVVTRDVEPFAIVAGCPARKIGSRPRSLTYSTIYLRPWH